MGGYPSVAYSQPLVCPSDCDQQTWQQILTLYDRLDANGDHAIENKELQTIAKLHIDNEIRRISRKVEEAEAQHKRNLTFIRASNAQEMARLRVQLTTKINRAEEDFNARKSKLEEHTDFLKNMEEEDKAKKFKEAVSGHKKVIDFWDFYNYMKCRVDDIPNIIW
jgi:cell fate (sporulation/competence/biofilm development) regulator YlbF (YheA/YmcA/DUF963 family)|tara:strand:+ start:150 stop:644 length:495 start_codon:yes stop_codon:yes gene_type:complete